MSIDSPVITPDLIASAMTYDQYVALSTERFNEGRSTTIDPHYNTPEILGYVKLNLHRMSRLHRLTTLEPELRKALAEVLEPWTWLVLTESWCGDAAQSLPVIDLMASESPSITVGYLLRDENPALMNAYLTNGGRSIPKLICLRTRDLSEIGTWGPRPAGLQNLMIDWRTEKLPLSEAVERAQRWYNDDHTQSVQAELLTLVRGWSKISV
ncbi:thioredoxin family protein [Spirosoma montaniterrae]|uniref:Thioredoxin n=1 Tax=Spirosoma montaniterrae TaxID=1178516 RepID=A0A1P9WT79_9BACT|nr:thioredoxin family protein [Spirosoma montaniterrae]AQG78594.1 hypothetical protein AWR27_04095 [Spirosoma montaniterrae]